MDTPERTVVSQLIDNVHVPRLEPCAEDGLAAERRTARGIVVAGRAKIDRALSGDSVGYLRRAKQQGGE